MKPSSYVKRIFEHIHFGHYFEDINLYNVYSLSQMWHAKSSFSKLCNPKQNFTKKKTELDLNGYLKFN